MKWNRSDTEEVFKGVLVGVVVAVLGAIVEGAVAKYLGDDFKKSKDDKDEDDDD